MTQHIGPYEVKSELGRGGMGVVYLGFEETLQRDVAIKVLSPLLSEDEHAIARFLREARSAASLSHPNVVQIYTIGEDEGRHYFAMEFIQGASIAGLLRHHHHLDPETASRFILQAAAGLQAAHDRGIIHRDIKPANLMVDQRGLLKITDFGLALLGAGLSRLTATGMLLGTPGYLSPEQCLDEEVDQRTDIYSLGASFFEMLAGVTPFEATSPLALVQKIVHTEPPDIRELNPGVSEELRDILLRMMAKKPADRYESCAGIIEDLQQCPDLGDSGASMNLIGIVSSATAGASGASGKRKPPSQRLMPDELYDSPTLPMSGGQRQPAPRGVPTGVGSAKPEETALVGEPEIPSGGSGKKRAVFIGAFVLILMIFAGTGAFLLRGRNGREEGPKHQEASVEAPPSPRPKKPEQKPPAAEPVERALLEPSGLPTPTSAPVAGKQTRSRERTSIPPPAKASPKRELRGIAVVARGESLLADTVDRLILDVLRRRKKPVVSLPDLSSVKLDENMKEEMLRKLRKAGVRYLLVIDTKEKTERELKFMGRVETAYESALNLRCLDLGVPVPQMVFQAHHLLEYTRLNVEKKIRGLMRRDFPALLRVIDSE